MPASCDNSSEVMIMYSNDRFTKLQRLTTIQLSTLSIASSKQGLGHRDGNLLLS